MQEPCTIAKYRHFILVQLHAILHGASKWSSSNRKITLDWVRQVCSLPGGIRTSSHSQVAALQTSYPEYSHKPSLPKFDPYILVNIGGIRVGCDEDAAAPLAARAPAGASADKDVYARQCEALNQFMRLSVAFFSLFRYSHAKAFGNLCDTLKTQGARPLIAQPIQMPFIAPPLICYIS